MTETSQQLPAPTRQAEPGRPRLWPLWLLSVLALLLALTVAFWNWQQWQKEQTSSAAVSSLQQELLQLQGSYTDRYRIQEQRLQSLEDKLAAQRELIATQQRQLDHAARELLEAGHRSRTDWLLAEAEYLLRIANQRLQIEKDISGALSALETADEVLADSDDIGVYPVRQQLAQEILSLKAIGDVDRTGLYLTLEAAIGSISQLTDQALIHGSAPGFTRASGNEETAADDTPGRLQAVWEDFKQTLAQVVVVRRLDEPVKPLLSPDQSAYARLNLQLMLEEAELAVLRGNQVLYERALAKAREALDTWYNPGYQTVTVLKETLAELAARNVDPELPDISQSLHLLKQRLDGRAHAPEAEPEPAAEAGGDAS